MENNPKFRILALWAKSLLFAGIVSLISYFYYKATKEGASGNRLISQLTADVGTILIAISFCMSGISYFLDKFDSKLIYRKYFGLIGFYLSVIHVYIALTHAIDHPETSFSTGLRVISFFLGIMAFTMFLQMAIVSNNTSTKIFGNSAWRLIIRYMGYAALVLTLVHFFIRKMDVWQKWLEGDLAILPPLSIITLALSIFAFVLRIALFVSLRDKDHTSQASGNNSTAVATNG